MCFSGICVTDSLWGRIFFDTLCFFPRKDVFSGICVFWGRIFLKRCAFFLKYTLRHMFEQNLNQAYQPRIKRDARLV